MLGGLVSGITKVFKSAVSGIARIGRAVLGVGATLFTGGAAAGQGGLAGMVKGLTGNGVLGNVLSGAIIQGGIGALVGGAIGAVTGQGFGKGALMGGLGGAALGGLSGAMGGTGLFAAAGMAPGADTATGFAPTGLPSPSSPAGGSLAASGFGPAASAAATTAAAPSAAGGGFGTGFGQFLTSEAGAGLLSGLGEGFMRQGELDAIAEERQKERDFLRDKERRITDSYNVPDSAFAENPRARITDTMPMSTAQAAGAPAQASRYVYDKETHSVIRKAS